jgi:hypothetical protein
MGGFFMRSAIVCAISILLGAAPAVAQFQPESANVNLYFPHLASGGPPANQWQTVLVFANPSAATAHVQIQFFADDGSPLNLNFGGGTASSISGITIPPGGLTVLTGVPGPQTTGGSAFAFSDVPVTGQILFRWFQNGHAVGDVTAEATLPTVQYSSYANPAIGVAIANPYDIPSVVQVAVRDGAGNPVGSPVSISLAAWGHTSFNLNQFFPLAAGFQGSVTLTATTNGPGFLTGWTLNVDTTSLRDNVPLLAPLPSGRFVWPVDQWDRVWKVYLNVLNTAVATFPGAFPNQASQPVLAISYDPLVQIVTADDGSGSLVTTVNLAAAEAMSDSDAELAYAIGYEMALLVETRIGLQGYSATRELDADGVDLALMVAGAYDPYGAAGVFGKLQMLSTLPQVVGGIVTDPSAGSHASYSQRITNVMALLQTICSGSSQSACVGVKGLSHPHVPPALPVRHGRTAQ